MSNPRKVRTSTRRTFIKSAAYAGLALPMLSPRLVRAASPNGKLRHVAFGAAGQAGGDLGAFARHKQFQLVAACEVDDNHFGSAVGLNAEVRKYNDFRVLIEKEAENFDCCHVSVPDHMHAPIAMLAMQHGKHVYCQKPLCHDVYEVRRLTEVAREKKLVTQMGIQIHSSTEYRLAAEFIQRGIIGKVKKVYAFSHKHWGGGVLPKEGTAPPANLHWDLWLGVAPEAPYAPGNMHPGNWRKFLNYGTGTFGDMGCHIYDPVYKAVKVTSPLKITSRGAAPAGDGWPLEAEVEYIYPGNELTAGETISITWLDGNRRGRLPQEFIDAVEGARVPEQGSIFIGEKGAMMLPHIGGPQVFPRTLLAEQKEVVQAAKDAVPPLDHYHQFLDAVLGDTKTGAGFEYSGPLTESILAGGIATRYPDETLEWDAVNMTFPNKAEANAFVKSEYRKGWQIPGLNA